MSTAELTRARERFTGDAGPLDLAPLAGRWITFSERTEGISELEIAAGDGGAEVRVLGSGTDPAPDWGRVPARTFADGVAGGEVWGFRATHDHGFERVELFGYLNRGLLCVEAGTTFADESGRSPYFTRSFYFRP